jgi:SAM-dependent methyltransferase
MAEKKILDMTCGSRTIWFNKNHPNAVYCDKRVEDIALYFGKARTSLHHLHVNPDIVCDFTALPFDDNSFSLVVFDPPHLTRAKETAWLVKKYGKLDEDWPRMLHDGFAEGMRVLKPDGVLIFKWSEYDIPAEDVWKAIGQKPLFGHHSGKKSTTFWGCFMKILDGDTDG